VNRILIVGVPRSGTTWVGHLLGQAEDTFFLSEPDNHLALPFALRAKRRLPGGFHPALEPGEDATVYERLWRHALAYPTQGSVAGPRSAVERLRRGLSLHLFASTTQKQKWGAFAGARRPALRLLAAERLSCPERPEHEASSLVVKSIYVALSVEWIVTRFPARVVIVERSPLNILSSWSEIGWLGRPGDDMLDTLEASVQRRLATKWRVEPPTDGASVFARGAWLIGALMSELGDAAKRNPGWLTVTHEDLCERPHERFRELAEACALPWGRAMDRVLEDLNRPGSGYDLFRVRNELRDAWRRRLTTEQVGEALEVLEAFPLEAMRSVD
jgi:hypothetical protein